MAKFRAKQHALKDRSHHRFTRDTPSPFLSREERSDLKVAQEVARKERISRNRAEKKAAGRNR